MSSRKIEKSVLKPRLMVFTLAALFAPGMHAYAQTGWTFCASENTQCSFTGTQVVRYGANTTYVTKTLTNGTLCSNGVFGDPLPGTQKHCDISPVASPAPSPAPAPAPSPSPTPTPATWTFCASENTQCSFTGTQVVRYGANTTYVTKTLTNGTLCSNGVFGDPLPGTQKHCDISSVASPAPTPTPSPTPTPTPAPTPTGAPAVRLEWSQFVKQNGGADLQSFIHGVQVMRANTNASDPASWAYWSNMHFNYCPHSTSYFLAWHRPYLVEFEKQLRLASGNPNLTLPYWDYYKNPNIPAEFTNPNSPLYISGRVNTNVANALSLAPFSPQVNTFQRYTANSYEASFEVKPHNALHNLIGGLMADLHSPTDPIFWLHHANVDRLWAAWVAAGGGRSYPDISSGYWNGSFTYTATQTQPRRNAYSTTGLSYTYDNLSMPTALPPTAQNTKLRKGIIRVQASRASSNSMLKRPADQFFTPGDVGITGADSRSMGGAKNIQLGDASVTAHIPLQAQDQQTLKLVLGGATVSPFGKAQTAVPYSAVRLVLDNLKLTDEGKSGGYFYEVYLNLPANIDRGTAEQRYLAGTFGAFEIAGLAHHGNSGRLVLPCTQLLANISSADVKEITVSLVRVNGSNYPRGTAITAGEARLEFATSEAD